MEMDSQVLFYIAAEDEAFMAFNRERDAQSLMSERESVQDQSNPSETDTEELLQLDGKSISEWLSEIDAISKDVEAELVSREIGCHLVQVLEAVNAVLFHLIGFKRTSITLDLEHSYLHSVLNSRRSTGKSFSLRFLKMSFPFFSFEVSNGFCFLPCAAFLISVIYIEVCKRLNVPIVGSPVGEDFLIWPKTEYPEELFQATSGQSLFSIANGRCVDDPGSMASDLTAKSLQDLDIATNRDIIGIALANLIVSPYHL